MRRCLVLIAALLAASAALGASGLRLKPFKDELFAYPKILMNEFGGDYTVVEYIKKRDLQDRDEEDERRVYGQYVSTDVNWKQSNRSLMLGSKEIKYIAVGATSGATMTVVYLHGQGGTRFQGANDWMFGGNFNRIKNLMARNGGLYVSPDFTDFKDTGVAEMTALIKALAKASPGAPLVVACGSYGGVICWALAKDPSLAPILSGIMLLGSVNDESFLREVVLKGSSRRLPIYLGHGSADTVVDWQSQDQFFRRIRKAVPDYPIRFTLFDSGSHGTPIRMTDWRLVLNWILEAGGH